MATAISSSTREFGSVTVLRYRTGKPRNCAEGVSVHVWLGDDVKYATVYGGSRQEAVWRADRLVRMLNAEALQADSFGLINRQRD